MENPENVYYAEAKKATDLRHKRYLLERAAELQKPIEEVQVETVNRLVSAQVIERGEK